MPRYAQHPDIRRDRVLYIMGAARSGSTVLSLLLGQHSEIIPGSQLEWIRTYAALGKREPCTCTKPVAECPFWRSVAENLARSKGSAPDYGFRAFQHRTVFPLRTAPLGWLAGHLAYGVGPRGPMTIALRRSRALQEVTAASRDAAQLFRAMRSAAAKSVVVDASKNAIRGKALYLSDPTSVRLVWLVRDGRGVAWSRMRRHGESLERATAVWLRSNLEAAACLASVPPQHRCIVRYEDLCRTPQRELDKLCDFAGVSRETFSLTLRKREVHVVGGNEMRFDDDQDTLRVDERWRENLTRGQLARFAVIAGLLNRRFGYVD
jgi:hypothetical protein